MIGIQKELPLEQVVSNLFRDFKGDEVGGQHATRGFNFQVWHAVLEALKAYRTGQDFAVVLEWQQDVAVLNSSTAPTQVRFVQLKKHETSTHWKLHHLSDPEKIDVLFVTNDAAIGATSLNVIQPTDGKSTKKPRKANSKVSKPSFLAKLYEHRRRFSSLERSRLEFASNAKYEVPDAAGGTMMLSSCELTALNEQVREELVEKLRIQLGVPADEAIDLSDFGLLVSDCPIANAHKHVAGELAEMQFSSELKLSGAATMLAVLVIASYVHQRAGSTRFAKNLSELLERAVTRNDINKYLIAADDSRQSTEEQVQTVINRLNSEQAPFSLVNKMNKELFRVCVEITNRAGPVPLVAAHLKSLYEKNAEFEDLPNVLDILAAWYSHFQKLELPDAYMYKREYLYCLMSMIIQNANPIQQLPPVSPSPQLEDQE
jgi:hypothetical protein